MFVDGVLLRRLMGSKGDGKIGKRSAEGKFFFSFHFFFFFYLWPGLCGLGGLKFLNAWLLLHPLTIAIYKMSKRGSGGMGVAEE